MRLFGPIGHVDEAVARDGDVVRQAELLRGRRVGVVGTERRVVRFVAVGAPHPLERERRGVEHDDAAVAVAVGHVDLVRHGIDREVGRLAQVPRVGAAAVRPRLAELLQELALARELQEMGVVLAAAGEPHVVLGIHEDAVLGLRPVVALARTAPRTDQRPDLVELENRRRRDAAVGLGRRVVGPREPFVRRQRPRPLHDVEVILAIDRHARRSGRWPSFPSSAWETWGRTRRSAPAPSVRQRHRETRSSR